MERELIQTLAVLLGLFVKSVWDAHDRRRLQSRNLPQPPIVLNLTISIDPAGKNAPSLIDSRVLIPPLPIVVSPPNPKA